LTTFGGLLPASFISLGRFSDAHFRSEPVSVRAQRGRWAASLDLIAFKEEAMGKAMSSGSP
jgi:hypothetical protein